MTDINLVNDNTFKKCIVLVHPLNQKEFVSTLTALYYYNKPFLSCQLDHSLLTKALQLFYKIEIH